jgi:hypothetical protein
MCNLKVVCFLTFTLFAYNLLGQQSIQRVSIDVGLSILPLKVQRNDLYRWLLFPSIEASYGLNDKTSIAFSFMPKDIRSYHDEKFNEAPELNSYEEAILYVGKRIGLPRFNSYSFIGISKLIYKGKFSLAYCGQVGVRFGESLVLEAVAFHPSFPKGFETHVTNGKLSGPGINLKLMPIWYLDDSIYLG